MVLLRHHRETGRPSEQRHGISVGGTEGRTDPLSYRKWALIITQASLKAVLASANVMKPHCGSVTTNATNNEKQQRIKASKLLTLLQQLHTFLTYFFLCC